MTKTRKRPAGNRPSPKHRDNGYDDPTPEHAEFDFDKHVVDRVDESIWRALFDGHFRLAVRCDICGRWLTDGRSKRAHRGPRCAAKAVDHG